MLKVGIIGCGKIADSHAEQILRIPGCEIVGACDREELMARQLWERFPVKACYSDAGEMLKRARPDVVHITTPPGSHFELGCLCLQEGCHVYIEKPFTCDTGQAVELIRLAEETGVKVTAGHDLQFSHAARRFRRLVSKGVLGGPPVHMESYYGYELGGRYAKALLGDKQHWIRRLPGKLIQNIISHGVARVAEHLEGDEAEVVALGFPSELLRTAGEGEIVDEARVIVRDRRSATAYITFSSQMRPFFHQFRLYGPGGGLVLDEDEQVVLRLRGTRFKSYLEKFVPPVVYSRQYFGNLAANLRLFLRNDFHMKSGMKHLIEQFYGSIRDHGPPPIPYREILLGSRIMDALFAQVHGAPPAIEGAGDGGPGCGGRQEKLRTPAGKP